MKPTLKLVLAALAYLMLGLGVVQAAPSITTSPGTQYTTGQVDGIKTTGADMVGMTVSVCSVAGCETKAWEQTGVQSGGSFGSNWSLTLNGDSFDRAAAFALTVRGDITSFSMDGRPGETTFDITSDPEASPGSELGFPFTFVSANPAIDQINVLYTDALRVKDVFYGDLYLVMQVDFGGASFAGLLQFQSDTDNTAVIERFQSNPAPEPATLALTAVALLVLAAVRRHRGSVGRA